MSLRIRLAVKRAFDIVVAAVALVVLSPVIAAVALAIKLDDGGPVLFVQRRVGLHGRLFGCYKFRTMVVGADAQGLETSEWDPRITRVGGFLRQWSLDEIPQVANVLRGDMSLVGPRPTVPSQVERYSPRQLRRHDMKPGMAGWAWIHGRNLISWEERIELDLWYIDNWSLLLDFKVFAIGLTKILRREGVYGYDGRVRDLGAGADPVSNESSKTLESLGDHRE
ncbi:MAG: sugar transferase [Acidobacteriota bacterium]|jgi:lipopolysaccharide/colanic/teichoic acid biosynthesis glycosyltransferase